jgi:hypothetical protein
MHLKLAAIVLGVVTTAAPGLAKDSPVRKHAAAAVAHSAGHKIAAPRAVTTRAAKTRTAKTRTAKTRTAANPRAAALPRTAGAVFHRPRSGFRRKAVGALAKRNKERETSAVAALERDSSAAPVNLPTEAIGWRLIEDAATGARLGLPEKLVPHAGTSTGGSRWTSAQGQIQIETFRLTEAALPALFEEEKRAAHRQVESSALKSDSFVVAGVQGLKNFLVRAEARGSEVRGIVILYDQATEGTMGRIARAMLGAFVGFPDPNAAAPAGIRRTVEYGTAIAVSADGDLVAPARLTDACQAITVSGFGHAERVAADPANDLALIRVYGARNMVPAVLAGDGNGVQRGEGGDITLVGIADPLAQTGGSDVSSVPARLVGQGLEPAPKAGFAGAAALGADGAVVGMVELKPAIVAGGATASATAALIPVDAIRAFLNAHGVTAGALSEDHPPMVQSVVRVICVRK